MTFWNRGAGTSLACASLSVIMMVAAGTAVCSLTAFAADPLLPEAPENLAPPAGTPPPPPTAPIPGPAADPLGSPVTSDGKPIPAPVTTTPPAAVSTPVPPPAPTVQPSPLETAAAEPSPIPSEEVSPVAAESPAPEESSKPNDVIVPVKQDEPDWPNINKKKYLEYKSHWAVEVDVSPGALGRNLGLGGTDADGNPINSQPWGLGLQLEYEPEWFQPFGVLSFGPSLNLYPAFNSNDDFPNAEAIWSIGAQIRYQFRYKEQQFLVPMIGYNFERLSYHLVSEGTGSLEISGPVLGLNILLNPLDPVSSTAFFFDAGVLKTYLVLEGRFLEGDNGVLDVSGLSWFFGVRMEF